MDMKAFIASLFLAAIAGIAAYMLLRSPADFQLTAGGVTLSYGSLPAADPAYATAVAPPPQPPTLMQPTAAAPPTPLPQATAPPTPPTLPLIDPHDPRLPTLPPFLTEAYIHSLPPLAATPYETFGRHLTYCHDPATAWTAEMRATTAAGFAAWEPTGLSFSEVAYAPHPIDCFILVRASADPGVPALGQASAVGPLWGLQSWLWSNTAHMPHNVSVVIHEVGHILGLPHTAAGVMQPTIQFGLWPDEADFARVRCYWFGGA
jgi:hypothetical protein